MVAGTFTEDLIFSWILSFAFSATFIDIFDVLKNFSVEVFRQVCTGDVKWCRVCYCHQHNGNRYSSSKINESCIVNFEQSFLNSFSKYIAADALVFWQVSAALPSSDKAVPQLFRALHGRVHPWLVINLSNHWFPILHRNLRLKALIRAGVLRGWDYDLCYEAVNLNHSRPILVFNSPPIFNDAKFTDNKRT